MPTETPREPDRFDAKAREVIEAVIDCMNGRTDHAGCRTGDGVDHVAAALRAAESEARFWALIGLGEKERLRAAAMTIHRQMDCPYIMYAVALTSSLSASAPCGECADFLDAITAQAEASWLKSPSRLAAAHAAEGEGWSDTWWCAQHGQPHPECAAQRLRALIPPAAAPAVETCRAECASRMPCALPMGHVGPHRDYSPGWTVAPPSDPAVPAGEPGKAEVCRAEAASRMPDYSHYECTLPKGHGGPHREGSVEWTDKDTVYP